ncbi:MAG: hypothetical protein SWY16_06555 [Cyanobacteriota bacterium]|nr:hypothetical protein [Cyanobacteriota bacterium]
MSEITTELKDRIGNIEQIRDILFGEKIQTYETRFQVLESNLASFQKEVQKQLKDIRESLSIDLQTSVSSIEKKLQYLSAAADDEIADLRQDLESNNQKFSAQIISLNSALDSQSKSIYTEISHLKESFTNELTDLQSKLIEELEKDHAELLEAKASKDEIAELFFELCMKLKGKTYMPESDPNNSNSRNSELLLPESENRL